METLYDARLPVLCMSVMMGGYGLIQTWLAYRLHASRRATIPAWPSVALAAWCWTMSLRTGLVVIGVDWRDIVWVHWAQVGVTVWAFYGLAMSAQWKVSLAAKICDLEREATTRDAYETTNLANEEDERG